MAPKRNEATKGPPAPLFGPPKPGETEIIVQKPGGSEITVQKPQESETTAPKPEAGNHGLEAPETNLETATNNSTTNGHLHLEAERLLFNALQQLQSLYNEASKTRAQTITIKKADFESIGNGLQQAYEHLKQPCACGMGNASPSKVENTILDTLTQIQGSIATLETKYNDIESKITNAPKTYADIIKSASSKASKIEQRTERRKRREEIRKEREKYGVTLSLKDMTMNKQQSILAMSAKAIAEHCQSAIDRLYVNSSDAPRIIGVSKLAKSFRIQFTTEDEADTIHKLNQNKDDIWNVAFEGLKLYEPMYGIVVHGIPTADLNTTMMDDKEVINRLEAENDIKAGTIVKITPLRRQKNRTPDSVKLHHSIVVYMNNQHKANKCIVNGFYVDYVHYNAVQRFTPQYQIMQCFNCCDYGHRSTNCKRHSRCGKCGENHNTRECKSTTVHCFQCKGPHEAWHPQCPARIAEKDRLEELMGNTPDLFN